MIRQSLGPLGGGGIQIDLVAVAKTVISEVKLHPEVAELIRRGDVITDVEDTSTIPIWRQGNMDMYTDESLAQRKELERDGSIRNAIEGFWSKLGYDESNKPTMAKHEFCNLYAMLVMTVTPENEETEEQLRIDAEEEWKNDIGSGAAMTLDQFIKSIFQLADHWTMDICASSYITFIRDLSTKVLKLKKARAAQAKGSVVSAESLWHSLHVSLTNCKDVQGSVVSDLYRYRRIKGQAPPAQSEANLKLIEARLRRISALNHPGGRSDWLKTIERRWNNRQGSVAIDPPLEEEEMSDDKAESVRSTPRDENDTELFTPPREFDSGYFIKPIRFYGDGQGTSVTPPTASEVSRKEISQEEKAQEDTGHPSA
eukprot:gene31494-39620_t